MAGSGTRRQRHRRGAPIVFAAEGIVVRRDPDRSTGRLLVLSGMDASYVDLTDPTYLEFSYLRRLRDVIDESFPIREPLVALHIGGGACTLARYLAATRPQARSEVYEVDPEVAEVARRQLGLQTSPRLRLRLADAREQFGRRPDASTDLVVGDAFVDGLVPRHLTTLEFTREVRRVLRPGGRYLLNVVDAAPTRIARQVAATLREVFADVSLVAPHRLLRGKSVGNLIFIASDTPPPLDRVRVRAARDDEPTDVLGAEEVAFFAAGAAVLTDPPAAGSGE